MPGDTITEVRVDKSKLGITIGSGRGAPKEPEKQYLEDLFQVKLVTGNGVRGEEGGGAVMPYDAPSQQALDDSKTLAEAKKKLDEARKEANTLARELSEAAGQTKSVSDFRGIRSPEERYKQAKDFKEALEKVPAVLAKFTVIEGAATFRMEEAEARDAKNGGKPVPKATTPEEWNTLRLQAVQARSGVRENGLPSGFAVKEGPEWHKVLIAELQPFCKGKDQKENEDLRATDLKAALSDDAKKKVAQAGKQFKETVQPYLSKGVNRASLFFDATTNGVPLSLEDGKKAKAAIDTLSQQGIAILNNGGSYKQVKEVMAAADLSEEFWPPELVQAIQAWRKTTRALQEERLRKVSETKTFGQETTSVALKMLAGFTELAESGGPSTIRGFTELDDSVREIRKAELPKTDGGSDDKQEGISGLIKTSAENAKVLEEVANFMNGAVQGVAGVTSVMDLMKTIAEMYKTGKEGSLDLQTALKQLDLAMEGLAKGLGAALSGMNMAKDFGGDAVKELMKKIVPGLGLAVAGVEFANALKDLAKKSVTLHQQRGTKNEGLAMFVTDDVDEPMLYAMNNALHAERTKVAKASIKVGTSGMEVAGNAATTFGGHFGAAAGSAISITATGIDMGSKAIFSGIDWGKANKAKKMLAEARAGNMEAQIEIFEHSNLYAKMFLAISVKEGSPLAKKYIIDRGIEEGDLDKAQSLEVLRDAMLNAAEQSNEQETEDSLVLHFGGTPGKALASGIKSAGNKLTGAKDRVVRLTTKTYKPAAKNDAVRFTSDPDQWAETWESAKETHIANGLLDESTGIGDALTKAAKAAKAVTGTASKETLLAAIDAMNQALQTNLSTRPVGFEAEGSPKRVPHKQAYESLQQMRVEINKKIEGYWAQLDKVPGAKPNWAPANIRKVTAAEWGRFWKDGQAAVAFPAGDAGVGEAIKEAETAKTAFETQKGDDRAKRKLAIAYVAGLDDVNDALLDCMDLEAVNRRDKARAAINGLMMQVNADRRTVDEWLAGYAPDGSDDWAGPKPDFSTMSAGSFVSSYDGVMDYAHAAGFLATKGERGGAKLDGGLRSALVAWEEKYLAYEKAKAPKDVLAAVRAVQEEAGRVKKRALQFMRAQRGGSDQPKEYASVISDTVVKMTMSAVEGFERVHGKVTFDVPTGKTALSSENWRTVYDNAVSAGAVLPSAASRKGLSKSLKLLRSDREKYEKEKAKPKPDATKLRDLARKCCESLNDVEGTIEMVRGLKRYGENEILARYLDRIVTEVKQARTTEVVAIAGGTSRPNVKFVMPQALDQKNWETNKKKAVEEGVIPDRKTGVGSAIGDYIKVAKDKDKRRAAAMKVRPLLSDAGNDSEFQPWHDYINKLLDLTPA